MGTAIAAIIAALVGGIATIASTSQQNKALEEAGRESRELATLEREDTLAHRKSQEAMGGRELRLYENKFRFDKSEAKKSRQQWERKFGYEKAQNQLETALNIVNGNQNLKNSFVNTMIPKR